MDKSQPGLSLHVKAGWQGYYINCMPKNLLLRMILTVM